jgi:hypothetical protein
MQYLLAHIPRSSPLHARLTGRLSDSDTRLGDIL